MRKNLKKLLAVSAAVSMLVAFAACGDKETGNDSPTTTATPTVAPTEPPTQGGDDTPTPVPTDAPTATPVPTEAPKEGKVVIHNIDGEKKRDTLYFGQRGGGAAFWGEIGCNSDGSIQVTGRSAAWHGVSLSFTDANYEAHDVIGKEVYVSFDLYQETGAPLNFSCTLQVNKPDGSTGWPERVAVEDVPSGEWVHIEGVIPVYANASAPSLNFETMGEGSETAEFFLDNIVISYDLGSSVDPHPDYEPVAKKPFENVSLDFSGSDTYFTARGDSAPTIVDGAMYVGGRTSSWNGAQVNFSDYDLAGKTITVSYKAKHDEAGAIEINATMEESDGTNTTYNRVASSGDVAPGEWVTVTGTYTILDTTVSPTLYFEATETASFYVDDVTITLGDADPAPAPTAAPTEAPAPTTAPAPADGKVVIHDIKGEAKRDTLYFGQRGGGTAFWSNEFGCNSDGSIQVIGRSAAWHGVTLYFNDASNKPVDVIGKEVYVSFDFYQTSGEPVNFNATLEVKKPDGSSTWPERVAIEEAPSGEWLHVEGMIPVYANAASPQLNFETFGGGDTAEFYLDNIVVSYDPNSSVDPHPDYEPVAKKPFEKVSLDFSGSDTYFTARGASTPTIVDGAMYVGGRTSSWNGAQVNFSDYDLAGKTITVSYKAKHDEAGAIEINATMEESDGANTTYNRVASSGEVAPGEWVTVTGTYTILDTTAVPVLYFEATETSSFYIDDVTITVE